MVLDTTLGLIFGPPGMGEMLILAAVGLLIFGKRLPEVGKSLGKGILEFKKGLSGVKDQLNAVDDKTPSSIDPQVQSPTVTTQKDEKDKESPSDSKDHSGPAHSS